MATGLLPTHEFYDAVVSIRTEGDKVGTGFQVRDGQECYLVTALHTVPEATTATLQVQSMYEPGAEVMTLNRVDDALEGDVAAFRIPFTARALPVQTLQSRGLALGQEVVTLGFPGGNRFPTATGSTFLALPMVKKGIVAAFDGPGQRYLYLDLIANTGFSGGPVIFQNDSGVRLVCGMVIHTASMYVQAGDQDAQTRLLASAGISTAVPIVDVFRALEITPPDATAQ